MTRRNAVVALLALVALAAGVLLWANRDAPAERTVRREGAVADGPARRRTTPAEPAAEPPAPDPDREDEPRGGNEKELEAALSPPKKDPVKLRGTIVVLDYRGQEHPREDGSFTLWSYRDDTGTGEEVEVADGRWEAEVEAGVTLGFSDIKFRGRNAYEQKSSRHPIPADGAFALRVFWPPGALLSVVSADTGEPLDHVIVASAEHWRFDSALHPGLAPKVVARGRSPVALPDEVGARHYWACAPGYAWGAVEFDHKTAGEREVRLVKGGDLEIELVNFDAKSPAVLRFYGEGMRPLFEVEPKEATVVVTDLPPRTLKARVEIGDWWHEATRLGEAEATVVAGARTKVALTLQGWEKPKEVPLEGTLVVPEAWGDQYVSITLNEPPGAPEPKVTLRDGRWSAKPVVPGRYVARVYPLTLQFVLDVGPSGLADARLEIPEPADVVVTVLDEATGKDANVETVHWHAVWPEGVRGGSLERGKRDEKTGTYRFRAPVGEISVEAWDDGFDSTDRLLELRPGRNEITLEVRRACGVHIVLKDGEATVPFGSGLLVELEDLEGDGDVRSTSSNGVTKTIRVTRPSRYRITFGHIKGFQPIPLRTITIEAGKILELEVPLERVR